MTETIPEHEMRAEIERLAPFHHAIDLPHGLNTHLERAARRKVEATRVSNLVKHAFPALEEACGGSLEGQRVLDIACNCGGFSIEASNRGASSVLGIDIVDRYLEQAEFLRRSLDLRDVEFRKVDLRELSRSTAGTFDVTFCFGILYHLEDPVGVMRRVSEVTEKVMLVDTTVVRTPLSRRPWWLQQMPPVASLESTDATTSLWRSEDSVVQFRPNARAVVDLLHYLGFPRVRRLWPGSGLERRYYTGRRVTFLAQR